MSLSSPDFMQHLISVLKGYNYSLKKLYFPVCGSTVSAVELYHFRVAVSLKEATFSSKNCLPNLSTFSMKGFLPRVEVVYSLLPTAKQWWIRRKNKYLCSLCWPNKCKKKKRTESSTWHIEWKRGTSVMSLINVLKAEKPNRNFSKYIKAESEPENHSRQKIIQV